MFFPWLVKSSNPHDESFMIIEASFWTTDFILSFFVGYRGTKFHSAEVHVHSIRSLAGTILQMGKWKHAWSRRISSAR